MGAAPSTPAFGSCPVSGTRLYTASNSRVYSQLPCGTDYPFNDLSPTKSVTGLAQCAEHCATVSGCQQAVWITANNICWPKSVARTAGGNTAVTAAVVANLYTTPTSVPATTTASSTSSTPTSTRISTTATTLTTTFVTTSRASTVTSSSAMLPPVTSVAAPSTSGAPSFAGYTAQFIDDFTGSYGSLPSASNWQIDIGTQYTSPVAGPPNWGTGEIQYYTSSSNNLLQSGTGNLFIVPQNNNGNWTSARIETVRSDFMAPAGKKMKIQAQIRLPDITASNGLGYWPAFWTLGGAYRGNYQNWPAIGEFDILENVSGTGKVYAGLHCGVNPGGVCNEPNGLSSGAQSCINGNCQGSWHTFTLDVDRSVSPESLKWTVDGNFMTSVTEAQINNATIWNAVVHQGHFLLLNMAMGGSFPSGVSGTYTPTSNTVSGKEMRVDYVGVWYSN